jgi:hypothetical protein
MQITQPQPAPIVVFCPECRSALDHVTDLAALIGLRSIPFADDADRPENAPAASFDEPASAAIALPRPWPGH